MCRAALSLTPEQAPHWRLAERPPSQIESPFQVTTCPGWERWVAALRRVRVVVRSRVQQLLPRDVVIASGLRLGQALDVEGRPGAKKAPALEIPLGQIRAPSMKTEEFGGEDEQVREMPGAGVVA